MGIESPVPRWPPQGPSRGAQLKWRQDDISHLSKSGGVVDVP